MDTKKESFYVQKISGLRGETLSVPPLHLSMQNMFQVSTTYLIAARWVFLLEHILQYRLIHLLITTHDNLLCLCPLVCIQNKYTYMYFKEDTDVVRVILGSNIKP